MGPPKGDVATLPTTLAGLDGTSPDPSSFAKGLASETSVSESLYRLSM